MDTIKIFNQSGKSNYQNLAVSLYERGFRKPL